MESITPSPFFQLDVGDDPIVATALHGGHAVRAEVEEQLVLTGSERRREEEPHTGFLTQIAATRIIAHRSRFEVDLDLPRSSAVSPTLDPVRGTRVWRAPLDKEVIARSLDEYDLFYGTARSLLAQLVARSGRVVILDLHSYNHRRQGPGGPPANPKFNPEIDVGTGSVDRRVWGSLLDRFIEDLRSFRCHGRSLDVRENVKFSDGHFAREIQGLFSPAVCVLTIQIKKTFVDEWTGCADHERLESIFEALESTLPGLRQELKISASPGRPLARGAV